MQERATWFCIGVLACLAVRGELVPAFVRGLLGTAQSKVFECPPHPLSACQDVAEYAAKRFGK